MHRWYRWQILKRSLISDAYFFNLLIKSVDRSSKSNSSLLEKLAVAAVVEHLIDLSSVVSSCVEVELEKLLDQESVAVSSGSSGDLSLGAGDFSVQFGD